MNNLWQQHQQASGPLPDRILSWPFFGNGLDSLGVNRQPVTEPLPDCGPDEILTRVDALGLCASDAKMVRMGLDYPLFFDRDMAANPVRLGHETTLTVVRVGANWLRQYHVGQRLGLQPDVYNNGQRAIFGVNLPGAMTQYVTLDRRLLAGDDGSYVFPVPADSGYAAVALLEPWACVDVAYSPTARRLEPAAGGLLWIQGQPDDNRDYHLGRTLDSRAVILSDVPTGLADQIRRQPVQLFERNGVDAATLSAEMTAGSGFDDIILLNPARADVVAGAVAAMADHGTLNLVTAQPLDGPVAVEVNKLHYQHLALLGCPGPAIDAAYGPERNRSELRPGGVLWVVGAGGSMGRMHLQRALEMPHGPRAIIATNRGQERLAHVEHDFGAAAAAAGVELVTLSPTAEPERLPREIERLTGGRGCDDIVVVVPNADVISQTLPFMAKDGLLVVFAGIQAGPQVHLPLDWVARHRAQFTGSSGSVVADQLRVLDKLYQGTLNVAQIIAAVAGLRLSGRACGRLWSTTIREKWSFSRSSSTCHCWAWPSLKANFRLLTRSWGRAGAGQTRRSRHFLRLIGINTPVEPALEEAMAQDYLIGVDLGTSVVKTTLFDTAGQALADATRETTLNQPAPGRAEQRAEDFYGATLDTIREVVEKVAVGPAAVAAITFDGQMAGAVAIDRDWNALTPWYPSALDNRYQPYIANMEAQVGDRLVALNGAFPFMVPRMLWWQDQYPELYQRIHKVLILAHYVSGRMADLPSDEATIDPSYLTWIGVSDTARRAWSPELAEACGIPLEKLPRVVPSTSAVGRLSAAAAAACGLAEGIPLVAGAGDQVAGFVGAGLVRPGQLVDVAGTFPVLATSLEKFFADTHHNMLQPLAGPVGDNHWYPMMYISGGGLTHRWYRDEFATEEKQQAEATGTSAYQLLDNQAATLPPGAEGLMFIPHLVGRACPSDPAVRGAWLGFTWTHRKPHFYRAVLESIAYDYAVALAVVREYIPDVTFSEVRVIGGGANSELWNQIKADVLGVPYVKLQREDVAALGCAIMGGHAVGIYPDLAATAGSMAQTVSRVEPRPAHHDHYQDYLHAYAQAFSQLRGLYTTLSTLQESAFEN
jgi:xylulokinase